MARRENKKPANPPLSVIPPALCQSAALPVEMHGVIGADTLRLTPGVWRTDAALSSPAFFCGNLWSRCGHASAQCIYWPHVKQRGCSSVILETFLHNHIASPLSCCTAFDEELLCGYLRATSRPNHCGTLEWLIEQHKQDICS